nr:probable peroxygenase 7 [Nicotiana tomentosiformis]
MASSSSSIDEEGIEKQEVTPLEKHVMFFDINKDGVIYPWETYKGFRKIGSGVLLSTVASIFINIGLSGKTRPVIHSFPLYVFVSRIILQN